MRGGIPLTSGIPDSRQACGCVPGGGVADVFFDNYPLNAGADALMAFCKIGKNIDSQNEVTEKCFFSLYRAALAFLCSRLR